MALAKKGLGRGLSALIPEGDMEMLRQVARGEEAAPSRNSNKKAKRDSVATVPVAAKASAKRAPKAHAPKVVNKEVDDAQPEDGSGSVASATTDEVVTLELARQTVEIPLASVEANPYQPRRHFSPSELEDLTNSIRTHGVLQPILVRPLAAAEDGSPRYQLVAGERRWRASQLVGVAAIPAIVREVDDQQALELALIENVQRHDISAIDAALAYKRLADEFNLSQEEISLRVGKSRSAVANTMRLLDLQGEIRTAIENGEISEGHGRAILVANGDGARRALFRRIVRDKLSVREAERLARESESLVNDEGAGAGSKAVVPSADIERIEKTLQKILGARVGVHPRVRGGRIVVEYSSVEELQRIIRQMSGKE